MYDQLAEFIEWSVLVSTVSLVIGVLLGDSITVNNIGRNSARAAQLLVKAQAWEEYQKKIKAGGRE